MHLKANLRATNPSNNQDASFHLFAFIRLIELVFNAEIADKLRRDGFRVLNFSTQDLLEIERSTHDLEAIQT